jgi:hypothetical protein
MKHSTLIFVFGALLSLIISRFDGGADGEIKVVFKASLLSLK